MVSKEKGTAQKARPPYLTEEGKYVSAKRPWIAALLNKMVALGEKVTGNKVGKG